MKLLILKGIAGSVWASGENRDLLMQGGVLLLQV